jgi:small GTP-binding protein
VSTIKFVALGEGGVGKTCILNQWLHGEFNPNTPPTIGVGSSTVQLMVDGIVYTLSIWDTAGTPQFRQLLPLYFQDASIAALVFDLTRRSTFDELPAWHAFIVEQTTPTILIVGNKLDAVDEREIDEEVARELAGRLKCRYVEVSAKTNQGMGEFARVAVECTRDHCTKILLQGSSALPPVAVDTKPTKSGCCQ